MNVLLLVLDGLSPRHVRPDAMPTLSAMAEAGGWNRRGGVAVMPASTYPNHATFVTGVLPGVHGLWSSRIPGPGDGGVSGNVGRGPLVEAWDVGPASPTVFDVCARAGRTTAGVFGDHHLVGTMGAAAADRAWPEGGEFGAGVARDALEYADDAATAEEIARVVGSGPDLVVAQLNGPDTAAHLYGPDSEEAFEAYRYNDAAIATVREALGPRWDDWVVMVVSDHSQEDAGDEAIDLDEAMAARGIEARVIRDGSAAIVTGEGGSDPRWLDEVDAVVGVESLADDTVVVWGRPGSAFGTDSWGVPGIHGSPRTTPQVAVVSGGHAAVGPVAEWVEAAPPAATGWARVISRLLQLPTVGGIPRLADPGAIPG
ncbi:MAG TPA: alkaline phosphatase family protein [Acidimicrobiales bacterium]|nr:alkaline phosphatase family protein [Acidimicrobiales bacterium]